MARPPNELLMLLPAEAAIDKSSANSISYFDFHVNYTYFTHLCHHKRIVTVNNQFPGPPIIVNEGDRVIVNVTNHLPNQNITIHWHGVRQFRSAWFDGPAYITQCPIMPGHSFLYNFTIANQRGTLFWHAHINWMRSTVHGPIIIRPKKRYGYPFPKPSKEIPIVLSEWWNSDTEAVINEAMQTGGGPNVSDAYTINGYPGSMYNCSNTDMFKIKVKQGHTYLLRIINAALNGDLFLRIAGHNLTVVEVDASYTKPFEGNTILIAPGQTMNVLFTADQALGTYALAVRAYTSAGPKVPFDSSTAMAMVEYEGSSKSFTPVMPVLPAYNDTYLADSFSASLRSLNSAGSPALVPKNIDRHLLFTVGMAVKPCPGQGNCQGPAGGRFASSMNNISFVFPKTALLQSFFVPQASSYKIVNGSGSTAKFHTDFPDQPTMMFDFTGSSQPTNLAPKEGTRLSWIPFNASVEIVLQDTSILGTENHPIHLHGYNFFVVGYGVGNFDNKTDPQRFNLVDPPERNTIGVPKGGWIALRFRADNPGVWLMHCHLEIHTSWGLGMAFLVTNGVEEKDSLEPPPNYLPVC
ncbi:hypothetical protein KP509_04G058500 [Ceratopteris richardii]|nr:hypothetical protein KP509_04G058500 [Ceratopteris richardii]